MGSASSISQRINRELFLQLCENEFDKFKDGEELIDLPSLIKLIHKNSKEMTSHETYSFNPPTEDAIGYKEFQVLWERFVGNSSDQNIDFVYEMRDLINSRESNDTFDYAINCFISILLKENKDTLYMLVYEALNILSSISYDKFLIISIKMITLFRDCANTNQKLVIADSFPRLLENNSVEFLSLLAVHGGIVSILQLMESGAPEAKSRILYVIFALFARCSSKELLNLLVLEPKNIYFFFSIWEGQSECYVQEHFEYVSFLVSTLFLSNENEIILSHLVYLTTNGNEIEQEYALYTISDIISNLDRGNEATLDSITGIMRSKELCNAVQLVVCGGDQGAGTGTQRVRVQAIATLGDYMKIDGLALYGLRENDNMLMSCLTDLLAESTDTSCSASSHRSAADSLASQSAILSLMSFVATTEDCFYAHCIYSNEVTVRAIVKLFVDRGRERDDTGKVLQENLLYYCIDIFYGAIGQKESKRYFSLLAQNEEIFPLLVWVLLYDGGFPGGGYNVASRTMVVRVLLEYIYNDESDSNERKIQILAVFQKDDQLAKLKNESYDCKLNGNDKMKALCCELEKTILTN